MGSKARIRNHRAEKRIRIVEATVKVGVQSVADDVMESTTREGEIDERQELMCMTADGSGTIVEICIANGPSRKIFEDPKQEFGR